MVKSYISAIKAMLQMNNIKINQEQYFLTSVTRACRLKNDQIKARLLIWKGMLRIILDKTDQHMMRANQPYLSLFYCTLFSTAYFGLFRVGELTKSEHQIKARDVHIATNKNKILFVLHTSKTHHKNSPPQMIKIKSELKIRSTGSNVLYCPYMLLRNYSQERGGYALELEPYFIFRDKSTVTPYHFRSCLKTILKIAGFNESYYSTHSLRSGCSCDLYDLGVPIDTIKKLGRWKSNAVYRYLKT